MEFIDQILRFLVGKLEWILAWARIIIPLGLVLGAVLYLIRYMAVKAIGLIVLAGVATIVLYRTPEYSGTLSPGGSGSLKEMIPLVLVGFAAWWVIDR